MPEYTFSKSSDFAYFFGCKFSAALLTFWVSFYLPPIMYLVLVWTHNLLRTKCAKKYNPNYKRFSAEEEEQVNDYKQINSFFK